MNYNEMSLEQLMQEKEILQNAIEEKQRKRIKEIGDEIISHINQAISIARANNLSVSVDNPEYKTIGFDDSTYWLTHNRYVPITINVTLTDEVSNL